MLWISPQPEKVKYLQLVYASNLFMGSVFLEHTDIAKQDQAGSTIMLL